jgi:hypothetical protein
MYSKVEPEFTPVLSGVRVVNPFVLFVLAIVFSDLRFTDSDYLPLVSSNSSCTCYFIIYIYNIRTKGTRDNTSSVVVYKKNVRLPKRLSDESKKDRQCIGLKKNDQRKTYVLQNTYIEN